MGIATGITALELFRFASTPPSQPRLRLRVALLADTATQFLAKAIQGEAHRQGVGLDLFEAEFNQIDLQLLDPDSDVYRFHPDFIVIYAAAEPASVLFGKEDPSGRANFGETHLRRMEQWLQATSGKGSQTVVLNLADTGDGVFGHYGARVPASWTSQVRQINAGIDALVARIPGCRALDLASIQGRHGREAMFDARMYYTAKIALKPDILPTVVRDLVQMCLASRGQGLKCAILDLDNTLWGGVVGDDGMEGIEIGDLGIGPAFTAFQSWLKQLRDRGIVLAVCSKNDEANAKAPFLHHPDMVLRLEDIAVFTANWEDKATNIRRIREIIEVDPSAMVFLDDNPAERALVRESFPTLMVPELPEDPADYVPFLRDLNLFETGSHTEQDGQRTLEYRTEAIRREELQKFVSHEEFLASLQMKSVVRGVTRFNTPRVAQLTQRSNQFNLRTIRYSEPEISALAESDRHRVLAVELEDRFGSLGLISVVILVLRDGDAFIDTWIMSCRVLKRGIEDFVLNQVAAAGRELGACRLVGEYLPTAKNGMVRDHYSRLGFAEVGGHWELPLDGFVERLCHVQRVASDAAAGAV